MFLFVVACYHLLNIYWCQISSLPLLPFLLINILSLSHTQSYLYLYRIDLPYFPSLKFGFITYLAYFSWPVTSFRFLWSFIFFMFSLKRCCSLVKKFLVRLILCYSSQLCTHHCKRLFKTAMFKSNNSIYFFFQFIPMI